MLRLLRFLVWVVIEMVSISGVRDRRVELVKKDGYEVVVFGGWPNWEKYFEKYISMELDEIKDGKFIKTIKLKPEYQWQWEQNYPELVVKDVLYFTNNDDWIFDSPWWTEDDLRDFMYGDLLYRGVNKWLMVRYLLVRYKKWVAEERNKAYEEMKLYEPDFKLYLQKVKSKGYGYVPTQLDVDMAYEYGYWKGYYDAMRQVRADLKTMAMTPRYVIWNGKRPGVVVDKKISRGWLELVKRLYDIRFDK